MTFYQSKSQFANFLLFIFIFIGTIIDLATTYAILDNANDINNDDFNKMEIVTKFPRTIQKIDVGQGEDIWILDNSASVKYNLLFFFYLKILLQICNIEVLF